VLPSPTKNVVPPPQQETKAAQQGHGIFFAPQAPVEEPKQKQGRPKKVEKPATIEPAPPVAQYGMQAPQPGTPPSDVSARLDTLFKLPPVK
jgi:hypothetical protein